MKIRIVAFEYSRDMGPQYEEVEVGDVYTVVRVLADDSVNVNGNMNFLPDEYVHVYGTHKNLPDRERRE